MPSGGAACSIRDARFTVLPMAVNSRVEPTSPNSTGPVFRPMRSTKGALNSCRNVYKADCMAMAALMARSGSSSRAMGTPHRAITVSPMCLSTVPPWVVMTASICCQRAFELCASVAANFSQSAVRPANSAKSTVTCLRWLWAGCAWSSASFCRIGSSAASTTASPNKER